MLGGTGSRSGGYVKLSLMYLAMNNAGQNRRCYASRDDAGCVSESPADRRGWVLVCVLGFLCRGRVAIGGELCVRQVLGCGGRERSSSVAEIPGVKNGQTIDTRLCLNTFGFPKGCGLVSQSRVIKLVRQPWFDSWTKGAAEEENGREIKGPRKTPIVVL